MAKVIRLNENDLTKIIKRVIEEQGLAVGQNFQTGQQQTFQAGQQAKQKVKQAVSAGAKSIANAGKQVLVTIGKVSFTILVIGGAAIYLIGKGLYKVNMAINNAIMKLISAVGNATVSAATAISQATTNALKSAGIAIEQGVDYITKALIQRADDGIKIIKYVIGLFKGLGVMAYAKVLLAANSIQEIAKAAGQWLKEQYNSIASQVGKSWDEAVGWAKQGLQNVKAGAQNLANKVQNKATGFVNKAANVAGQAWGAIKGFMNEFFIRLISMENKSSMILMREMKYYNNKSIL